MRVPAWAVCGVVLAATGGLVLVATVRHCSDLALVSAQALRVGVDRVAMGAALPRDQREREAVLEAIGWSSLDAEFYESYFVVPNGDGIADWLASRPRDWNEYREWSIEAEESGATVSAVGKARRKSHVGADSYRWARAVQETRSLQQRQSVSAAVREVLREELEAIVKRLSEKDFGGAASKLRTCGGWERVVDVSEAVRDSMW